MAENKYLVWQEKLKTRTWYRRAWVFFGIYSILAIFVLGLVLIFGEYWKVVIVAAIAFLLARAVVSPIIFYFYKKQRPYQKFTFDPIYSKLLSLRSSKFNSFPSDHALSLASLAMVFYYYIPVVGVAMFVLMLFNGYARIILGYHDGKDIIGGFIVGILCALFTIYYIAPVIFTKI